MRQTVLSILFLSSCVSAKSFNRLALKAGRMEQEQAFQRADLAELRKHIVAYVESDKFTARVMNNLTNLALEQGKKITGIMAEIVKLGAQIKNLEWQNQLRVAQITVLEKQRKDFCARLRKRLKQQDICDEIVEKEKTDNQKLLDKFNKEAKERRNKKGKKK